ncbi:DUF2000 family protein [Phototrophicus methaneseepsis]|uniref:DUF2000 family protein n=2 Tax=Phototrophicus methaneseepsis TaxID=2710758 RepID=A0A7S8IH72_9CHLR|nr:DUF2000 family protein [Phototrophicus methaneseepsis]
MTFDTKIAIVLRDDLEMWQELNVTAFIASAVVGQNPSIIGENYRDASGNVYMPMIIQPMMIYQADADSIRKAHQRALERDVMMAIFTMDLFSTPNDVENRAAVADKHAEALDLVGIAMRDTKKTVDKVIKGLKRHP